MTLRELDRLGEQVAGTPLLAELRRTEGGVSEQEEPLEDVILLGDESERIVETDRFTMDVATLARVRTKPEPYEEAKALAIGGRSKMGKRALADAIVRVRAPHAG